jgi:hypothetical protein
MTHQPDAIRNGLMQWVQKHAPEHAAATCEETFLLRNSSLAGYRFAVGPVTAIWLLGENTVEVRNPYGKSDTLVIGSFSDGPEPAVRAAGGSIELQPQPVQEFRAA